MSALITGQFAGVYQMDDDFFARFIPDFHCPVKVGDEFKIPIMAEQFHSLPLNKPVKLIVEICV